MKKIAALFMSIVLLIGFASCNKLDKNDETTEPFTEDASEEVIPDPSNYRLNEFDDELIAYLCLNGYDSSDFMISPTALRAALCLAAEGAQGNTRTELLRAAGFASMESLSSWYMFLKISETSFAKKNSGVRAFSVENSVWNNTDILGEFSESYISAVKKKYNADAYSYGADEFSQAINDWINQKTDGMITTVADEADGACSVLLSTVHLRTAWMNAFSEATNKQMVFVDIKGDELTMDFMEQTAEYYYTEENGSKVLVIPMEGNMSFVCFLGNRTDRFDKMTSLQKETVHVVLPKFELASVFDSRDLLSFLLSRGVSDAINERTANFFNISRDTDWFIQEIIQKNKLTVDESGIGSVKANGKSVAPETEGDADIKDFIADRPFSFAIFSDIGTNKQHMLFYGQVMNGGE